MGARKLVWGNNWDVFLVRINSIIIIIAVILFAINVIIIIKTNTNTGDGGSWSGGNNWGPSLQCFFNSVIIIIDHNRYHSLCR